MTRLTDDQLALLRRQAFNRPWHSAGECMSVPYGIMEMLLNEITERRQAALLDSTEY